MPYTPGVSTVVDEKDLNKPHLVRSEKAEEAEKQTEDKQEQITRVVVEVVGANKADSNTTAG